MRPEKQATIMQAINAAELKIEYNNARIVELQSNNTSLLSSIKLLKFELNKGNGNSGFGDSMNFAEDGIGIKLACSHNFIGTDGICSNCKEKIS